MTSSKMHYIEIARILGNSQTINEAYFKLTAYFKQDNPRFDETRFKEYTNSIRKALCLPTLGE